MKKYLPTLLVVFMLLFGFALLFYPDVSTWWNGRIVSGLVDQYERDVAALQQARIEADIRRATEVNEELSLLSPNEPFMHGPVARVPEDYMQILNVNGLMGRIVIPAIELRLPIYHTTTSWALYRGVGHLEGTAFPIGGYGTHSVLTAHTGLPNMTLFTNLEGNVGIGDLFFIYVLDRKLAYEVDQILTVWPHESESLRVSPGEDLVTLITCTPYGQNHQRLLVRGRRVEYYVAAAIVEYIEADFVENRIDMRIYIFLGFFALFMLGFIVYQIIIGRREQNPVPVPVAALDVQHQAPATASAQLPIQEIQTPSDSAPPPIWPSSPESAAQSTLADYVSPRSGTLLEQYMAKGATVGGMAHINRNAQEALYTRPKPRPGNLPITSRAMYAIKTNKVIAAACAIALVFVIGAGIWALGAPTPIFDARDAILGFESRLEVFRETHPERVLAEMMAYSQNSGELGILNIDALDEDPFARLLQQVNEYNRQISENGQPHLPDPFSYSQSNFNLNHFGFNEEMIGFVTIPRLNAQLPIFMGTSQENLHRGLAHLTGTSLPVGGESTNAVIAGYMELGRNPKLRGIDQLDLGDEIQVTNFYETIVYAVVEMASIHNLRTEALMIQRGMDLITLLTFQENNPEQWYIVVAQRVG